MKKQSKKYLKKSKKNKKTRKAGCCFFKKIFDKTPIKDIQRKSTLLKKKVTFDETVKKIGSVTQDSLHFDKDGFRNRSYSPTINKDLRLLGKTGSFIQNIFGCDLDWLNNHTPLVNVSTTKEKQCVEFSNQLAQKVLLNNIHNYDVLDVTRVITPKQVLSNCWFNSFFVIFMISDKGRKFMKYFRHIMITGKLKNGKELSKEMHLALFGLNVAIEASYQGNDYAYEFDTNSIIMGIYDGIPSGHKKENNIFNVNEFGNPIMYYQGIMSYLSDGTIRLIEMFVEQNDYEKDVKSFLLGLHNANPHIFVVNMMDDVSSKVYQHGYKKVKKIEITKNNKKMVYKLDSVVLRSMDQQHFSAFITINRDKYGFDGASHHRLNKFDWEESLNKNETFTFQKKDVKYSGSEFNFTRGYQILIYYLNEKIE